VALELLELAELVLELAELVLEALEPTEALELDVLEVELVAESAAAVAVATVDAPPPPPPPPQAVSTIDSAATRKNGLLRRLTASEFTRENKDILNPGIILVSGIAPADTY
jgi:hypothetical protein